MVLMHSCMLVSAPLMKAHNHLFLDSYFLGNGLYYLGKGSLDVNYAVYGIIEIVAL